MKTATPPRTESRLQAVRDHAPTNPTGAKAPPKPWIISSHQFPEMEFSLIEIHGRAVICLACEETPAHRIPR